jgi:hypothetical protein
MVQQLVGQSVELVWTGGLVLGGGAWLGLTVLLGSLASRPAAASTSSWWSGGEGHTGQPQQRQSLSLNLPTPDNLSQAWEPPRIAGGTRQRKQQHRSDVLHHLVPSIIPDASQPSHFLPFPPLVSPIAPFLPPPLPHSTVITVACLSRRPQSVSHRGLDAIAAHLHSPSSLRFSTAGLRLSTPRRGSWFFCRAPVQAPASASEGQSFHFRPFRIACVRPDHLCILSGFF